MTERYRMLRLLLICCLFATAAGADIVRLAVGLAKPPYVEAGGNSGLEVALALATLRLAGWAVSTRPSAWRRSRHCARRSMRFSTR